MLQKNAKLKIRDDKEGVERKIEFVNDTLQNTTFLPQTVEYKDIDNAFTKWVDEELRIVFEDEVIPTYALFSNQRFTEYMQMSMDATTIVEEACEELHEDALDNVGSEDINELQKYNIFLGL